MNKSQQLNLTITICHEILRKLEEIRLGKDPVWPTSKQHKLY